MREPHDDHGLCACSLVGTVGNWKRRLIARMLIGVWEGVARNRDGVLVELLCCEFGAVTPMLRFWNQRVFDMNSSCIRMSTGLYEKFYYIHS